MPATPAQALGALLATLLLALTAGQPFISLTYPSHRKAPDKSVPFNCTAGPFSSRSFSVTWFKDNKEHPASTEELVADSKGTYSVTSKMWVTLTREDVLSRVTCKVAHGDLIEPLQKTVNLSQVLYIIPTLRITTTSSRTHDREHQRVNLTCHAARFYPSRLQLTWMKNGHKIRTAEPREVTRNPDGTYSVEHTLPEGATPDGSEFACWAVQGDLAPVQAVLTLQAASVQKGRMSSPEKASHNLQGPHYRSEPGTSIRLTCTSFRLRTPHDVTVTWLKNNHQFLKPQTKVHPSGNTYNLTSSVSIPLRKEDLLSFVHCVVKEKTSLVFQKNISLNQYLCIPPTVTVSRSPVSSNMVAVTCHVQGFYPDDVYLTWLEDCHMLKKMEKLVSKQNKDGSYTLESSQLVNASVHGSEQVLTCRVQHEKQHHIQASIILPTASQISDESIGSPGPETPVLIFVAFLLGLKVLLVVSFTVAYICRWWNP